MQKNRLQKNYVHIYINKFDSKVYKKTTQLTAEEMHNFTKLLS